LALSLTGLFDFSQDFDRPVQTGSFPSPSPRDNEQIWTPPPSAAPAQSLSAFITNAWPILEPATPFVGGWHLEALCAHLEAISRGELDNLLVNVPPGTTKSLAVAVFWPAWEWTWQPWTRWLTSSYDDGLALRDAVATRRLMQTVWYRDQVTVPWAFASDQNVKGYYLNDRMGWRIATSVAGANTGRHAHRVVVDDPHNVKTAESDIVREGVLVTWREVYPSRVLPGGARVMVGQRVHEEDVSADWLEREGETVHHLELRMEHDPSDPDPPCALDDRPHDPRTRPGELLAPERFGAELVERRKVELGAYAYAAQYDQRPTPRAGAILDPRLIQPLPETLREQVRTWQRVQWWDLNYSELTTADFTAGLTLLVEPLEDPSRRPRLVIAGLFHKQLAAERHAETIGQEIARTRPDLVCVAQRAYEHQFATRNLCRGIQDVLRARYGVALTIDAVAEDQDKVIRARIIEDWAKAGLVYVDARAVVQPAQDTPFWPIISREMTRFPKSGHDDTIDALSGAVRTALERLRELVALRALGRGGIPVKHALRGGRRG
jgi:predicted phage terminase large subunit-like protein